MAAAAGDPLGSPRGAAGRYPAGAHVSSTQDVIVVGAGVTGLALADRLRHAGLQVLVLEARDRVGGRLLSAADRSGAATLDLGASWCWPDEPRVQALVARLGLPMHEQHIVGDAMYQDASGTQRLAGNPIDGRALRFSSGAQSLAHALAARLDGSILLSSPVSSIRVVGGASVEVEHANGCAYARYAVVALPPALAVAQIDFDPPLPPALVTLASGTPVWMGAMTKVVAEYAAPFWREAGLAGAAMSHAGPLRELHDLCGPHGQPAASFGFAPAEATMEPAAVIGQLVALFGEAAAAPLALHAQCWRAEQWTSPPAVERLANYATFGDPRYRQAIHSRVWLGSTETAPAHPGHIEGALESAAAIGDAITAAAG